MENQSQRYTVKAVGKRSVGRPHCALCGCTRETAPGSGVCAHGCFWNLLGWVGYRVTDNAIVFKDARGLKVAAWGHCWLPENKTKAKSWPKIVVFANSLGWSGDTAAPSQPTFIAEEAY